MKLHTATFYCLLLIESIFAPLGASAQRLSQEARYDDPQFAPAHSAIIGVATGTPYLGISEIAYGISARTTIGVMGGLVPRQSDGIHGAIVGTLPGYGIRVREVLYDDDRFRVYGRMPILYYPRTAESAREPWFLAWPTVATEWHSGTSTRYWLLGGVAAKACAHSLFGAEEDEPMMGGATETLGAGISTNVAERVTLAAEASLVTQGFAVANAERVGGTPVIAVFQATYALGN